MGREKLGLRRDWFVALAGDCGALCALRRTIGVWVGWEFWLSRAGWEDRDHGKGRGCRDRVMFEC